MIAAFCWLRRAAAHCGHWARTGILVGLPLLHPLPAAAAGDPFETKAKCELWTAKWVGLAAPEGVPIAYFRRELDLEGIPHSVVVHASANRFFKLYLNERFVGEGPPRNVAPYVTYSSFEVQSVFRMGRNAIAMEVFGSNNAQSAPAAILQVELRDASGRVLRRVGTDDSWRVAAAPWQRVHTMSAGYSQPEVFDARREPVGWRAPGFQDSGWALASVLAEATGRLPGRGAPTVMEPSQLPHYQRTPVFPARVVFAGEVLEVLGDTSLSPAIQMATEIPRPLRHCSVTGENHLLGAGQQPAVIRNQFAANDMKSYYTYWDSHEGIPAVRDATIIVDFGDLMNAYVSIDVEGNAGAIVDIAWGQTLIEDRVLPVLYARGPAEPEGKPNSLHATRYYLRDGRQQWETFHWQNFRYLQLTFRRLNSPLKLHRLAAVRSEVPMVQRGVFRSSDDLLGRLFASTGKTLRLASYDTFMDNTIREKTIWGGDISDGSVGSCIPVFGDAPMLKLYMDLFSRSQFENGLLASTAGGGRNSPWFSHPIKTAIWMSEYGYWAEDTENYKSRILPVVFRYLDYLNARAGSDGLLSLRNRENDWVDWVSGRMPSDTPVPVNLLYAILLEKAARAGEDFGEPSLAAQYRERRKRVLDSIHRGFWDAERGLYIDGTLQGKPCGSFSEHANYLALKCGLGRDGRQERILQALRDPALVGDIVQANAPFMIWPLEALFAIGDDRAALDMIRSRYSRFLRNGGDTFWEEFSWLIGAGGWGSRYRSLAQNGAGSPAWFLATQVLGVKPLKPRFREFEVRPQWGDLSWAEGVVPSPAGDIPVRWDRKGERYSLAVSVPSGTVARVHLPKSTRCRLDGMELKGDGPHEGVPGQHAFECSGVKTGPPPAKEAP